MSIAKSDKIVLTGGAGLVGLNLVVELRAAGFTNLVVIDKLAANLEVLRRSSPRRASSRPTSRSPAPGSRFRWLACAVVLHAQITGLYPEPFVRNNLDATRLMLTRASAARRRHFVVDVSSSVVNSVADDDYTRTKKVTGGLVAASGLPHCVLRPTLMFGWFDPKHLGWLARFMEKTPVFPIPGDGRYMRQPLYIATSAARLGGHRESAGRARTTWWATLDRLRRHHPPHQEREGLADGRHADSVPIFVGMLRVYALEASLRSPRPS